MSVSDKKGFAQTNRRGDHWSPEKQHPIFAPSSRVILERSEGSGREILVRRPSRSFAPLEDDTKDGIACGKLRSSRAIDDQGL